MKEKEVEITERMHDIDQLKKEAEKNEEQIGTLTLEIGKKNDLNENLTVENENMKIEITNKASMLARCAEAIRRTGDQIKTVKEENRELRKAGYNNPKMDKLKRRQEEEKKTKDEKLKQEKNNRKMVINNIASIEEWITGTKHETTMPKESNKKDLEEKIRK